jgi:hypothetical protein
MTAASSDSMPPDSPPPAIAAVSAQAPVAPDISPLTTAELRRLAARAADAERQRKKRAREAMEKAAAAVSPNPDGYVVAPMPGGLSPLRRWVREAHNAYSERKIGPLELAEIRRSATALGELYRVGADLRKAEAAIRAAQAQERMAEVLAAVEHGGTALLMLARLQDSLAEGRRRPIPGVVRAPIAPANGDGS